MNYVRTEIVSGSAAAIEDLNAAAAAIEAAVISSRGGVFADERYGDGGRWGGENGTVTPWAETEVPQAIF